MGKETAFAHTIKVEAKRLTGAGDTWDGLSSLVISQVYIHKSD